MVPRAVAVPRLAVPMCHSMALVHSQRPRFLLASSPLLRLVRSESSLAQWASLAPTKREMCWISGTFRIGSHVFFAIIHRLYGHLSCISHHLLLSRLLSFLATPVFTDSLFLILGLLVIHLFCKCFLSGHRCRYMSIPLFILLALSL